MRKDLTITGYGMADKVEALQVEYSSVCNMAHICTHCYGATGVVKKPETLTEEVLRTIIEEAKFIAKSITITGGEPACFPDVVRRISNESGLPIMLMTNGLEFIEDVNPSGVLFSLDGHDVRPVPDLGRILRNVERYNCNLACNTVLSRGLNLFEYYKKLKKLNERLLVREQHVIEWKLGFIIDKGKAVSNKNIFPDIDRVFQDLRDFLVVYFEETPFPLAVRGFLYTRFMEDIHLESVPDFKLNPLRNPCLDCLGRGEILTVNTSGHVQLCTVSRDVSVPIRESLIDAVLQLLTRKELTKYVYQDWIECLECRYRNICGCGCPSLATTYGNEWTGKDPFQCMVMERWEKYIVPILPEGVREVYQKALK